jgi:HD-like signal output (HDOD) protein
VNPLEQIRPKIRQLDAIPAIPAIIQPLSAMLELPADQVKMNRVVELVSYDSTIAAQCLRMANSPLFGRRNTETILSAVMAIGLRRVQSILFSCCLNQIVPPDKWAFDALTFWRHSLGCALVSRKIAKLMGYADPEKAYLAGLVHDLGMLVNTVTCTESYRKCVEAAREKRIGIEQSEIELLGFTHGQSGKILAEQWKFSADMKSVIANHHNFAAAPSDDVLTPLIHLSDLLCRLRGLGYGYDEVMGLDLAGDQAWLVLAKSFPALAKMDLARLSLDIDGAMDEIVTLVEAVFRPPVSA